METNRRESESGDPTHPSTDCGDSCPRLDIPTRAEPQDVAQVGGLGRYQYSLRILLLTFPIVAWCLGTGNGGLVFAGALGTAIFLFIKGRGWSALGIVLVFLGLSGAGAGDSVEVHLRTGDQRLLFWGIPIGSYRQLNAERRQALLSLNDPQIPSQWVWCATRVGSNNADIMVIGFYREATAWVEADPEIAKLVVRDIATYLQATHATHGLPECIAMIWPDVVEQTSDGKYRVVPGWRKNPEVQRYLSKKGYVPP